MDSWLNALMVYDENYCQCSSHVAIHCHYWPSLFPIIQWYLWFQLYQEHCQISLELVQYIMNIHVVDGITTCCTCEHFEIQAARLQSPIIIDEMWSHRWSAVQATSCPVMLISVAFNANLPIVITPFQIVCLFTFVIVDAFFQRLRHIMSTRCFNHTDRNCLLYYPWCDSNFELLFDFFDANEVIFLL